MNPPEILATILENRGVPLAEREAFLSPDFSRDLHNAAGMLGMSEAVQRIAQAVRAKEKVVVFGDYDADGVPGTALMIRSLAKLGLEVLPLIPFRADGYGLTAAAVGSIQEAKPDLLITVDNGTVAAAEVALFQQEGIEVIVIDHHDPHGADLAPALALVNPKQVACPYPFKELCACGLVWKLLWELYKALGESPEPLKWELDLVALSTVADMVPLLGENRVLVTYGLKVLAKTRNQGLRALAEVAGVAMSVTRPPTVGDIGFKLAPRINAPSRMHQELFKGKHAALQLLLTATSEDADEVAHYLNEQNTSRQDLVEAHLAEAYRQAEVAGDDPCLVVYDPSWSTGVIGLVASKLMESYKRPVVVLAPEAKLDGGIEVKGSVRSLAQVEALDMLEPARDLMERFGGHAKAAGLTLVAVPNSELPTHIAAFHERLRAGLLERGVTAEGLAREAGRAPDLIISLADASLELADSLENLAPFGLGFPTPLFRTTATITGVRKVGREGSHLSCFLEDGVVQRKAIAFRQGDQEVEPGRSYTIDFTLAAEEWRQVRAPVCTIQRIEPTTSS